MARRRGPAKEPETRRNDRRHSRITLGGVGVFLLLYGVSLAILGVANGNLHSLGSWLDIVGVLGVGLTALIAGEVSSSPTESSKERIGIREVIGLVVAVVTLMAALLPFLSPISNAKGPSGYDIVPLLPCQERNEPVPTVGTSADSPS
jgi:drug/metabolite transporter (DMT)-like permease